jgi:hypothetical protein
MSSSADSLTSVPAALRPKVHCALGILLEAFNSAGVSERDPWDFAVEIADLRAAGVTKAVLRLLIHNGLVEHEVERTTSGNRRRFSRSGGMRFSDKSCFMLTEAGARAARVPQAEPVLSTAETPYWNDANHTLFWRGQAIDHYKSDAPYQEAVVRAFEAQGWVRSVTVALPEDPGVSPKERLHNTIQNLNRKVRPHLRFGQEGSGSRVYWEPMGTVP